MSTDNKLHFPLVVIGSGPGGYTAAFRAADLGLKVLLIEKYATIGGVCLNVGCIPSKALLHSAKVIDEAHDIKSWGVEFAAPKVNTQTLKAAKDKVVGRLTGGLKALAKQRGVTILQGVAEFQDDKTIIITTAEAKQTLQFDNAIIAAGSRPVKLPFLPDDPRIIDSTGALELAKVDGSMLVIGGGIIGLEMATVYRALGCKITVVELMDGLMPGADRDLVKPYHKFVAKQYEQILLKTKVTKVEAKKDGLWVTFEGEGAPSEAQRFDQILSAVGRRSNSDRLGLDNTTVKVNERGFIEVNNQMKTNVPNLYAIGDIVGQPMLAHKAVAEARVAAEVISGLKHYFTPACIPSVAYTDPEVAWTGVTEEQAKAQGLNYGTATFPWMASGRALSMARDEGLTKLIVDNENHRVIGAGIVGPNAGELISELCLAIEMGADVEDIALTIHPHPTLSESVAMAAEIFEGTVTDLYMPKKKKE